MAVERAPENGGEVFGEAWPQLVQFAGMIEREGERRGLVGPRELDRLWSRHILNSAAVLDYIPVNATVADVGSGAGFPGLVVAICRPDVTMTLIDSMERRCEWLVDAVSELGLTNVSVRLGRSEEFVGQYSADVVLSRAVAALKKLLPWTMPLVRPGGALVALKGIKVDDEIDAAVQQLRKYKAEYADVHVVTPPGSQEETRVLVVKKKGR